MGPNDFGLGGGFLRVLRFPLPLLTTTVLSWQSQNKKEKVMINQNPNTKLGMSLNFLII